MKKKLFIAAVCVVFAFNLNAQNSDYILGSDASYYLPLGTLAERFNGTLGVSFFFGKSVSERWTWIGRAEYFKLSKENRDKLIKKVEIEVDGSERIYLFPLDKLEMEFEAAGISAEAKYKYFSAGPFESNLFFSFGFFYWDNYRSSYNDTLKNDINNDGNLVVVEVIDVPALRLNDWNGAISVGIDAGVVLFDPLRLYINANYKLIIGELWPTLRLGIENVSGLQFINLRAGLSLRL